MKTTIDIPDSIARRIGDLAEGNGRDFHDQIVQVLRLLLASDASVATWETILRKARGDDAFDLVVFASHRHRPGISFEFKWPDAALSGPVVQIDPVTGLQVILSPPDAPIHSMTADQFQALVAEAELEGDLERAGLTVRHK